MSGLWGGKVLGNEGMIVGVFECGIGEVEKSWWVVIGIEVVM